MKLTRIEPIVLRYPEPNDFNNLRHTVLVRVTAADGTEGWGEAIAMWPEACKAVAHLIDDGLADTVLGMDVTDPPSIWQTLKRHTWWYGEGGLATMALSAIDMAVWDCAGKCSGRSLSEMLGGAKREELPAIASLHVNHPTIEDSVSTIAGYIASGFRGAKLGFGKKGPSRVGQDPAYDVDFVRAVRTGMGPDALLMIDIGNGVRWDAKTAIWATNRMAEYDISWIEEPLHPDDWAGLATMRKAVDTRLATGEREWTVAAYGRLIDTGLVDVFGVDPARAEGITGFQRIAGLVEQAGAVINAHAWSTAITSAASLHLSLATSASEIFELKPIENPMQHELVEIPIWHENGQVRAPNGPGLGVVPLASVI
ncbi:MAG: mandelate racemase/muconate lactonizing enzyme family protein, partial [Pseudomonadota bacterium]